MNRLGTEQYARWCGRGINHPPIRFLIKGAVGTPVALTVSLTKTVPLILTGLAVAVAQKSRVFNIGAEGQLLVGAFAAGYVGFTFHLPAPLHICLLYTSDAADEL